MIVETGYADVNGARIYYETAGEGTPLVLVHGYTLDLRMWDDQFELLDPTSFGVAVRGILDLCPCRFHTKQRYRQHE